MSEQKLSEGFTTREWVALAVYAKDHDAIVGKIAALESSNERMRDLVRYKRHELFNDDLISQEEFSSLVAETPGSVARLEGYDKAKAEFNERIAALEAQLKISEGAVRIQAAQVNSLIAERDQLRAKAEKAEARLNETFTDDDGTIWTVPTAWAYAQACKAVNARQLSAEKLAERAEEDSRRLREIRESFADHEKAVEALHQIVLHIYPDATRSDHPYYTIRSHMAAVLRSLDRCRECAIDAARAEERALKICREAIDKAEGTIPSANAGKAQPVETNEKSVDNKGHNS
ncbi:MAG TPA: hypothetical protein VKX49_12390 [Bryobacteraceae bacterium]|nr:hypothetical protein [Bryobacteraceae bacterium]